VSSAVRRNVHIVRFDLTVSLIWTSLSSKDHGNVVKTRRLRHWMQGKMLIISALRSRCGHYNYFRSVVPSSSFFLFSSPNLSGHRVHVYHTYLIVAIVMTFRVLEGHPHIARIFKCDV